MAKPFQVTKISGLQSLSIKLSKSLPQQVRARIKQAIAEGADEMVGTMRNLAPELKQAKKGRVRGALKNSIIATMGGGDVPRYAAFRGRKQGRSRNSKVIEVADPELAAVITAGNNAVRYAHMVEFGTAPHINGGKFAGTENPGAKAQPFFYPGYRANKKQFKNKVRAAIRKGIKEAAGQ
jgi:HK97 gp10 family phage protein